jgi:phage FluMu gp28-like protein
LAIEGEEIERETSHPQSRIMAKKIILSNRSEVRGVPGKPATLRGETSNLVIDEGDHIENQSEFMRAVLGLLANEMAGKKQLRYITTPLGKNSLSYKIFNEPKMAAQWSKRAVNIYEAVLMAMKQDISRLRDLYGADADGWAQEYMVAWVDDAQVLLPYSLIASCESLESSETDTPEMLIQSPLGKVGGIDFGRVTDPTVMVTSLRGAGISLVRSIVRLNGMSTPQQIETLAPYIDLCDAVAIDYTGPGIGFGDLAVARWGTYDPENHEFGKIMLRNFTQPFKRDIFPNLRVAFEQRNIRVPISAWLREDLHSMAQIIHNGQYSYKAPRTDEGHSDGCTALALCEYAARMSANVGFRCVNI